MRADETDRLVRALTPADRQTIALLDLQVLARENAGRERHGAAPTRGVLECLRLWEILISRMEEGWPRQDYYQVGEYLNDLTCRDRIEEFLDGMPAALRIKIDRCARRLDARFRAVTHEDGGSELARHWRPLAEGREVRWWWTRRPTELPPGW